jgi:hypothetical protein
VVQQDVHSQTTPTIIHPHTDQWKLSAEPDENSSSCPTQDHSRTQVSLPQETTPEPVIVNNTSGMQQLLQWYVAVYRTKHR